MDRTGWLKIRSLICLITFLIFTSAKGESEQVRKYVEYFSANGELVIGSDVILCQRMLTEHYFVNQFDLTWTDLSLQKDLIEVLEKAPEHGLNSEDYHMGSISVLNLNELDETALAEKDLLLTDAFLLYASHLLNGKLSPETIESQWMAVRREGNALETLGLVLTGADLKSALAGLAPKNPGYDGLKNALSRYRDIADEGGWPVIDAGETLKPGMVDERVSLLISRLQLSQDLSPDIPGGNEYTQEVANGVKAFQKRHGLEMDGNVGKQTLEALNVSVEARIEKILINLERNRWMAQNLGDHYVVVNVANFAMDVVKNNEIQYSEKVIVGKPYRKTPVFSSKMTYMVINPYWTIPPTILFNDILPAVQKDPGYLKTKNIRVFAAGGNFGTEIDPGTVDWNSLSQSNFPYTLRQDPGPDNALGVVKFMFPNKYNVYLHDTPSKELFNRSDRAFSSGCIRVNNPLNFVDYLIQEDKNWNEGQVKQVIGLPKDETITLKNPVNVHIFYMTAWSEKNIVYFRNDVYERDAIVLKSLQEKAPTI